MEGVFIEGMEMPFACVDCPLKTKGEDLCIDFENGLFKKIYYCKMTGNEIGDSRHITKNKGGNCPLRYISIKEENKDGSNR